MTKARIAEELGNSVKPARYSPANTNHPSTTPYVPFPSLTQSPSSMRPLADFGPLSGQVYPNQQPPQAMANPYYHYPQGQEFDYPGQRLHPPSRGLIPATAVPGPGQNTPPDVYRPVTAFPADYLANPVASDAAASEKVKRGGEGPKKRRRSQGTQAGKKEVEAGLALAGLGSGMSGEDLTADSGSESKGKPESSSSPTKAAKKSKQVVEDEVKPKTGHLGKKSCAECRRMKAKCDRVFPCSNCRKRGCALVCPDQDLSCMQGKRLVLATTEELHDRVAELEAALAHAHKQIGTSSPHPLLSATHLDPKGGGQSHTSPRNSEQASIKDEKLSPAQQSSSRDSFALQTPLSNGDNYPERTQSRMAVESLLIDEGNVGAEGRKEDDWVGANAAPALIVGSTGATQDFSERQIILHRLKAIVRVLPDRETTKRKANRFWTNSTWYQNILRREEFEAIYEPSVYAPTPVNPLTPHKLACVLMLLCLNTYLDIEGSHENPLVGEYWEGAQRCFETHFGWGASLAGVQALALASLFVGFGWRGSGASNFYWLRQMTSAAQQLGLHKDPHPSLSISERTFRRRVFHEMYTLDCLMSINHGQRTAIPHDSIEAKYPEDDGTPLCRLKYEYMGHIKRRVIEIGCAPESLSQDELEGRVQALSQVLDGYRMELRPDLHCPILTGEHVPPPAHDKSSVNVASLTRCTTSMCHYKSMMFLHRPLLRRLIDRLRVTAPGGRAGLSEAEHKCVRATFEASTAVIAISGFIARYEPRLATRLWSTWVQTFSSAVSLAALAIWCGPYMEEGFVRRAYEEMRGGCDMIQEHGCNRAQGVLSLLPILCSLVENRYPGLVGSDRPTSPAVQQGEDMLFVLLGGQINYPAQPTPDDSAVSSNTASSQSSKHRQPIPQPSRTTSGPPRPDSVPLWNNQVSIGPSDALPIHWLQPPNMSAQGMSLGYAPVSMGMPNLSNPALLPQGQQHWLQSVDQAELWARLQTFYEPSLAVPSWAGSSGGGLGGMPPGGVSAVWGFEAGIYGTS